MSLDEKERKKLQRDQQTNARSTNEIMEVAELMMRLRWKTVRPLKIVGQEEIVNSVTFGERRKSPRQ
jgi:hypothetical protein